MWVVRTGGGGGDREPDRVRPTDGGHRGDNETGGRPPMPNGMACEYSDPP